MSAPTLHRGFSLIEALAAITTVAVLGALAYPMYNSYITKARRADAVKNLVDVHTQQQHFFHDNRTYAATMSGVNLSSTPGMPYTYELLPGPDGTFQSGYAVVARPETGFGDTDCGELWIDHNGVRKSTKGDPKCWQ